MGKLKGAYRGGSAGHIRNLTPGQVTATDVSLTEEPESPRQKLEGKLPAGGSAPKSTAKGVGFYR